MSDKMRLIPFDKMVLWALNEYRSEGTVFGVPKEKFYQSGGRELELFGRMLENPLGPAAGPNTQLAQNIVASYLTGSRFFELKTVQIIDGEDLPVSKPCILATDECYNVEWSTELKVPDAFCEYVKAWFMINLLSKEFSLGSNAGLIFNMSVGYDLDGIKSEKIDTYIEGMKDASNTAIWKDCKEAAISCLGMFKNVDREYIEGISYHISNSITLSTLHGCPPQEIERIARYLMTEKGLNTFIKCNPTMLGYKFARETLDAMGFDYISFGDHHFKHDLQFPDAVSMLARLKEAAKGLGLSLGVKLTNTFPVKIENYELPGEEMYMSGRSLHPLSINLAYKLAKAFDGDLKISFSGGADYFNIDKIYRAGIWPITLATSILKPGGYSRLEQLAKLLEKESQTRQTDTIDLDMLKQLAEDSIRDKNHQKSKRKVQSRKLNQNVPLVDCFIAPCKEGCPIGQDVPEYIRLIGEGRYLESLEMITEKNPLPFITGTICAHRCMTKCTRIDYDEAVDIRNMKLIAAENAYAELLAGTKKPEINSGFQVAVIGGGPAGLSAAYFLGKNGVDVTVFDKKDEIGGIPQHIIPDFRIKREAIHKDMELVRRAGVKFRLGAEGHFSVDALKNEGFKYIFIAIGAWNQGRIELESSDKEPMNVLDFLEKFNRERAGLKLGRNVAVIGAGNSAMDAARAAKKVTGVENVYIVYRRTKKYMPADIEEIEYAVNDGIILKELLAPLTFNAGKLKCRKMILGAPDESGRRIPTVLAGEFEELEVDDVIVAVGEKVEDELLAANCIELDAKGSVKVNKKTNETSINNVFIGGDALRGPATIVEGIHDGSSFARHILEKEKIESKPDYEICFAEEKQSASIISKKAVIKSVCKHANESERCLECNQICNICVEVCPNRANIAVKVDGMQSANQVIHIDGMCNECGNCMVFCPYDSAPYKDKFTLYWSEEDFNDSSNAGFVLLDAAAAKFKVRLGDKITDIVFDSNGKCGDGLQSELADIIYAAYKQYPYLFI